MAKPSTVSSRICMGLGMHGKIVGAQINLRYERRSEAVSTLPKP